jgi:hypothetical protein
MTARNVHHQNTYPSFTRLAPHSNLTVESPSAVAMLDIEDFDAVFADGVTYSDGIVHQIQEYQHALGGRTFFERLLDLLKIKGTSRGPPAAIVLICAQRQKNLPSKEPSAAPRPARAHHLRPDIATQQALLDLLSPQRPVCTTPPNHRTCDGLCARSAPREAVLDVH